MSSLPGVVWRSSDVYLRIACCWTVERLARRNCNKEKGQHALALRVWREQGELGDPLPMHFAYGL